MIMQSNMTMMECVIKNGTVESCMAIYLGMAMEMPYRSVWWLFLGRVNGGFNAPVKVVRY